MDSNVNSVKVLITGDVNGNFDLLFKKVDVLNEQKGPFNFCVCIGDFFSLEVEKNNMIKDYESGIKSVPIPFFIMDNKAQSLNLKSTDKLKFVYSNYGSMETVEGFHIVYIINPNKNDIEELIKIHESKQNKLIDFLITDWPSGIILDGEFTVGFLFEIKDRLILDERKPEGSKLVSKLALQLKPRYHFSGKQNVYYHRTAYNNKEDNVKDIKVFSLSRFISLCPINNNKITKAFHALCLLPINRMTSTDIFESQRFSTFTDNPYVIKKPQENVNLVKVPQVSHSKEEKQITLTPYPKSFGGKYFSSANKSSFYFRGKSKRFQGSSVASTSNYHFSHNQKKKLKVGQDDCWFCVGNAKIEKHFIIHVKKYMYLTRAKGGLTHEHMIITSLQHFQSLTTIPDCALIDLKSYKSSLINYYSSKGYDVVFYERNFKTTHLQIHAIPISKRISHSVLGSFFRLCKDYRLFPLKLDEFVKIREKYKSKKSYFYIELPNNMNYICENLSKFFPLFFARMLLSRPELLNMPERINWRDCVLPVEQEYKFTILLKDNLKKFLE